MNTHPSRPILLLVACLVAVAALAALGRNFFVTKTALFPALVVAALLSGRLKAWVADWGPFLAWTALFDALRGLTYAIVIHWQFPVHLDYVIGAEKAMLGGQIGSAALQSALFNGHVGWLERAAVTVHASHFLIFMIFGMVIWIYRPDEFRRFSRTMLAVMYIGLLGYLAFPTVPPWMASSDYRAIPAVIPLARSVYNANLPALQAMFDVNPIAAMPSLHAAFPLACFLAGYRLFGRRAWPLAVYAAAMTFSIVYLGEHYVLDVLAGWAVAAGAYYCCHHAGVAERVCRALAALVPRPVRVLGGAEPGAILCLLIFLASQAAGAIKIALESH